MASKTFFKLRGYLVLPPLVVAMLNTRWETEEEWVVWGVGGALFLLALALRVWAQTHLCYRLPLHKPLATTGPYHYTRNPIYMANTMLVVALVWLMEDCWLAAPTVLYCALVYSAVIRYEEQRLLVNFGPAYRQYAASVPRWGWRLPGGAGRRLAALHPLLVPALLAEVHCLLFLVLPAAKELWLYRKEW